MELSKEQFKSLLDNINWEITDTCMYLKKDNLKVILDKSLINYEEEI